MRGIISPVKTYSVTLGTKTLAQSTEILPGFGALEGLLLELTVSVSGATDSVTSETIDNVIASLQLDDRAGKSAMDIFGTDIAIVQRVLSTTGYALVAPAITTDASGAGSATYNTFVACTMSAADMNGSLKVKFAAASSLENTAMTSAGTVTVTLVVRAVNTNASKQTMRIKATSPAFQTGENAWGSYLPAGLECLALFVNLNGCVLDYASLYSGGAALYQQSPIDDFTVMDELFQQGSSSTGYLYFRVPVFPIDSTTVLSVNLTSTSNGPRLYSFATAPQKRS